MQTERIHPVSGHVRCVARKRASQWYAKYRLPDGRQVQKRLGPAWTGNGRPPAGYFTKRTAQQALQAILTDARRGNLPGQTRTGATFQDAATEWLRHAEHERHLKPSTLRDYRSAVNAHLLPAFGPMRLEDVTTRTIEQWRARGIAEGRLPRRTASKLLAILNGIFQRARRVWGLSTNPVSDVGVYRESTRVIERSHFAIVQRRFCAWGSRRVTQRPSQKRLSPRGAGASRVAPSEPHRLD